jgi:hypothetical protein
MANSNGNVRLTPKERKEKAATAIRTAKKGEGRRKKVTIAGFTFVGLAGVAIIIAAAFVSGGQVGTTTVSELPNSPAATGTAMPPWPAPVDSASFIKAAGLRAGPMGVAQHYHAHLDILVNGVPVPVPAQIGIVKSGDMSALHTHDPRGVLHVEAPEKNSRFTLGQVFTQWDVRLTSTQIGGLMASDGNVLKAYVNGTQVNGDPAAIELAPYQQITLVYGPANANVDIPSTFAFDDSE